MKLKFQNEIKLRVRYGETDQMGYCYYGNYAQYFEVGRVEALRSLGISYKELENQGIMLPVSEYNVTYRNPAKYDDELRIITKIKELSGARLFFDYEILNMDNKLVANASTTLIFVKKSTMKPTSAPNNFLSLLDVFLCEN
jgi:acyl-CoA thioester hydrolase